MERQNKTHESGITRITVMIFFIELKCM